jgi:MYXO-CTERM domain-containing protein
MFSNPSSRRPRAASGNIRPAMSGQDNPRRREEPAHDVLAAEAFAVPTADPTLRHPPITLPDDPSGIAEPHDVLAAEEFAMPAPRESSPAAGALARAGEAASPARIGAGAAIALLALIALRRRRHA